ncbi:MAG: hypothetical protein JSS98_18190 [Bacteroidetes bacterium]|nr:hypothetical protein [Bacteroidota bacterium]
MTDISTDIKNNPNAEFRYILVGNIIDKHYYGEDKEIKSGTKQFRADAKVYLLPEYGGMGHENMPVYGLPRKSWKKIKIVIRPVMIKNVRVKKTFDPKMIEMATDNHFYSYFGNDEAGLSSFAASMNKDNKEVAE